jgi:hypothetical protein
MSVDDDLAKFVFHKDGLAWVESERLIEIAGIVLTRGDS